MSSVSEIPSDRGWLRWKATAVEWLAVIISSASVAIALISMFVTSICIGIIWAMGDRIEELSDEIGVLEIRVINAEKDNE